jgi:hypothetical protein
MALPYIETVQYWLVRIFIGLGGIAGMSKIIEWLTRGPKIIGEVENRIFGDERKADGTLVGANLLLQLYLVNKRISPVTVRGFAVSLKPPNGKWTSGSMYSIPNGFKFPVPAVPTIDFASARLYDKVGTDVLEYGKGIRGWLRIVFPGIENEVLRKSDIKIEVRDAFNNVHIIKAKFIPGRASIGYFPGAGIKQE